MPRPTKKPRREERRGQIEEAGAEEAEQKDKPADAAGDAEDGEGGGAAGDGEGDQDEGDGDDDNEEYVPGGRSRKGTRKEYFIWTAEKDQQFVNMREWLC